MRNKTPHIQKAVFDALYKAGEYLKENAFEYKEVVWKHEDDPVTQIDRKIENIIKKTIQSHGQANFIGEEYGKTDNGAKYTFIIDPIDGTKSFLRKEFDISISVGVESNGNLFMGAVYDVMRDILYYGTKGNIQTYFQGKPVRDVYEYKNKNSRILAESDDQKTWNALVNTPGVEPMTRSGSTALSIALVAAGIYDGMVQPENGKGNVWDVAGGIALINPKKYIVKDIYGKEFDYKKPTSMIILNNKQERLLDKLIVKQNHKHDVGSNFLSTLRVD